MERVSVFEVDFPDVARRKAALISSNHILKDALPDRSVLAGMKHSFVFKTNISVYSHHFQVVLKSKELFYLRFVLSVKDQIKLL